MSHLKPDTGASHRFKYIHFVPIANHFSVLIPTQRRGRDWFVGSYSTLREAVKMRDAALLKQRTRKNEQKTDTAAQSQSQSQ